MWPLSVFGPAERSVGVSSKTFRFIIDTRLLILKFVDCLFKALCFDYSQSFLYNSCKPKMFAAFNPHTTQFLGEEIWATLGCWCGCDKTSVCHVAFDAGKSVPHYSSLSLTFNICDQRETLAIDLFAVHRQACSAVLAKQKLTPYNLQLNSVRNHLCHEQFTHSLHLLKQLFRM